MLSETDTGPFESRALDPELAESLGARFRSGRFEFDYRHPYTGALYNRKLKTLDKKYTFEKAGLPLVMWGLDQVPLFDSRPTEPLVITEGEEDRIAFHQVLNGNRTQCYVISVPNGVAGKRTEEQVLIKDDHRFGYLWNEQFKLDPKIEQFDRIILAVDDDEMGHILRDELSMRLGEARCWFVTYPKGCKDGNDALKKYGPKAIEAVMQRVKPVRPGHLISLEDIPPTGRSVPYSTGMGFLDKHLQVIRPELMVVTGIPGSGKGQFSRALAGHLAEAHGWRTAFLVPEDPAHRLQRDLRRFALRSTPHASPEQQEAAQAFVRNHFLISTPPEDEPITMDLVVAEMETAALHHGCQVFVIDPWNEISYDPIPGESETKNVERQLVMLKQKARRLNMLLIIVAHPRKQDGEEITLYSISGSANWYNKADHGIILIRNGKQAVRIIIGKSKDHETMGVPGEVWAKFERMKGDYVGIAPPPPPEPKKKQPPPAAQAEPPKRDDGIVPGTDGVRDVSADEEFDPELDEGVYA